MTLAELGSGSEKAQPGSGGGSGEGGRWVKERVTGCASFWPQDPGSGK